MKKEDADYWISRMLSSYKSISDLNLTPGKPLQVESEGRLLPVTVDPAVTALSAYQTESFALALINNNERLLSDLYLRGSCDMSYSFREVSRFRVNIFKQQGKISCVLRKLEDKIPDFQSFAYPKVFPKIADERTGLVLFTGATGTGKTTSLAALINHINQSREIHMVTLEDPIEYRHPHLKATLNQRELGNDFKAFADGLRAALRQAPKVIFVGEMRDRETLEVGLTASETGHLVFSTLHTIDAGQTINRILGMFEQEERLQIRSRLADTLRWTVSQRLLPRSSGGRVAAMEIMFNNLRVKEIIHTGETSDKTFYNAIRDGEVAGMQTFDQHILAMFRDDIISEETAVSYASSRSIVIQGIDQIKTAQTGEISSDIKGLTMISELDKEKYHESGF